MVTAGCEVTGIWGGEVVAVDLTGFKEAST
jgi:hypothetical protein